MYKTFLKPIGGLPGTRGSNPAIPATASAVVKIGGRKAGVISYAEISDACNSRGSSAPAHI